MTQEIILEPTRQELVSPERYLEILENGRANVASVRVVPPTLGEKGFGSLLVDYKRPVYGELVGRALPEPRSSPLLAKLRRKVAGVRRRRARLHQMRSRLGV